MKDNNIQNQVSLKDIQSYNLVNQDNNNLINTGYILKEKINSESKEESALYIYLLN